MGYLCSRMKLKQAILILQVSFLLMIFGAATFYFQYVIAKKNTEISSTQNASKEKSQLPITEEEGGSQDSNEEESQDEDTIFHDSTINILIANVSVITFATVPVLDFKEIHFEIVTPPPQS
jgi:hypothetical protein